MHAVCVHAAASARLTRMCRTLRTGAEPENARSLAARAQRCRTRVRCCILRPSVVLSVVRAAHSQAADDARGVDGACTLRVAPPLLTRSCGGPQRSRGMAACSDGVPAPPVRPTARKRRALRALAVHARELARPPHLR